MMFMPEGAEERDELRARVAELEAENKNIKHLLRELNALVCGECPSLLNEDSGGDSRLALEIEDALKVTAPKEPEA